MNKRTHSTDAEVLASYLENYDGYYTYDDPEEAPNNNVPLELEDIECTDRELESIEETAEVLVRERTVRQNHERELIKTKNNLQAILESHYPVQMKLKFAESINESLKTKVACLQETNADVKERFLRSERENHYMTAIFVLNEWKRSGKLPAQLSEELMSTNNNTISVSSLEEVGEVKSTGSILSEGSGEESKEEMRYIQQMRSDNQRLEGVVIALKQTMIPIMIAYENVKDEFDEFQEIVKERKRALEAKLRAVEEMKKKISRNDAKEGQCKENINPQMTIKQRDDNKVKLRDIYMDYEEKSQDLSTSRINLSTVNGNKTVLQEASSKLSKMFGSIFKGKKQKGNENILTPDVLKDLGIGSMTKR